MCIQPVPSSGGFSGCSQHRRCPGSPGYQTPRGRAAHARYAGCRLSSRSEHHLSESFRTRRLGRSWGHSFVIDPRGGPVEHHPTHKAREYHVIPGCGNRRCRLSWISRSPITTRHCAPVYVKRVGSRFKSICEKRVERSITPIELTVHGTTLFTLPFSRPRRHPSSVRRCRIEDRFTHREIDDVRDPGIDPGGSVSIDIRQTKCTAARRGLPPRVPYSKRTRSKGCPSRHGLSSGERAGTL